MILSDFDLRKCIEEKRIVIDPFTENCLRENGIDLRLGGEIARIKSSNTLLDYRDCADLEKYYEVERGESFIVNPHEHILITTLERIKLPVDIMAFIELRSTYARLGLTIPPTVVDANFEGQLTVGVTGTSFPIKLYVGDRILHLIFAKLTNPVSKPYLGKYQYQRGVTLPILKE
jgi:dCTP deaminase